MENMIQIFKLCLQSEKERKKFGKLTFFPLTVHLHAFPYFSQSSCDCGLKSAKNKSVLESSDLKGKV